MPNQKAVTLRLRAEQYCVNVKQQLQGAESTESSGSSPSTYRYANPERRDPEA
jgi:hypothetical protein